MKRCQTCGRELQDPATTCAACDAWAAAVVESPTAAVVELPNPSDPVSVDAAPAPRPAAPARPRRNVVIAAATLAAAALGLIGFVFGRPVPAATLAAAPAAASAPIARSPAVSASVPLPVSTQAWTSDNKARWLGDERGAAWELTSDNVVQTWFGPSRPLLVVRCTGRSIDAILYTGSPMMIEPHVDGKTVSLTVDADAASTERWLDADHRDALFAPDGAAFARRIVHATTLQFGYTPHNFSPVVARFHVAGLAPLIEHSARDCGWR